MDQFEQLQALAQACQEAADSAAVLPEWTLWNRLVEVWDSVQGLRVRVQAKAATDWHCPVDDGVDSGWVVDGFDDWHEGVLFELRRHPWILGVDGLDWYPQIAMVLIDGAYKEHLLPLTRLSPHKCELF